MPNPKQPQSPKASSPKKPPAGAGMAEVRAMKAGLFQALANPTRIHIVECLRDRGRQGRDEVPMSILLEELGVERANLSQHLGVLRGKGLVTSRKEGNQVWCRLRDRRIGQVLDLMKGVCEADVRQSLALLEDAGGTV